LRQERLNPLGLDRVDKACIEDAVERSLLRTMARTAEDERAYALGGADPEAEPDPTAHRIAQVRGLRHLAVIENRDHVADKPLLVYAPIVVGLSLWPWPRASTRISWCATRSASTYPSVLHSALDVRLPWKRSSGAPSPTRSYAILAPSSEQPSAALLAWASVLSLESPT
jgi:hypothetical protein